MKSVKNKLFLGFAILIFLILFILSLISIKVFSVNQKNESLGLLDETLFSITDLISKNDDRKIENIDRYVNLKNQFLIILKDKKVFFTNRSNYRTNDILEEIYEEEYEDREKHHHKKDMDFFDKGEKKDYFRVDEYILIYDILEKNDNDYEIYVGIDEDIVEGDLRNILFGIIVLNSTIFIILLVIGYFLINRTIKPLKVILDEVNSLQNGNDLSKRLKEANTKDEFEQLTNSFNKMLNNIENSVDNIKQFSSDASHELKTPLTVIQGEIELCQNSTKSKEELSVSLEKINKEQKKLQEIIKNFLLLSRLDKEVLKNKKALLDKITFESIELNLEKIEAKNLELKLDIEEDLEVDFDEKYLYIVINNLLTNAIKYTNEGFIALIAKRNGNKIIFEISDSGIGISKEDKSKIFERFYRVDKARTCSKDGIGLGLSIVKKICDRFETSIDIQSKEMKGSTFKLIFTA